MNVQGELEPKEDRREKDNRWKELKKMGSGERGERGVKIDEERLGDFRACHINHISCGVFPALNELSCRPI